MSRSVEQGIAELKAFPPADNGPDHEAYNRGRLHQIFEGFRTFPDREKAVPAIFDGMERHPDAELGSPGL